MVASLDNPTPDCRYIMQVVIAKNMTLGLKMGPKHK